MKWVKVAIGAVIAIMSIGIIATSVYGMTKGRVDIKEVEFTINVTDGTYTPNVFEKFLLYSDINNDGIVTNILETKLNGNVTDDLELGFTSEEQFTISSIIYNGIDFLNYDGIYQIIDGVFQDGDIVSFTYEVTQPPQLTGSVATLILLTPIICIGGFLIYLFRKQNY